MREAVPGSASTPSDPSIFSIGQYVENNVVNPTAADVSKICQDMNNLQVRFNKISSADFKDKSSGKPWKPEVTPPRRRGGFNRGRGGKQFENMQRDDRFKNTDQSGSQYGNNGQITISKMEDKVEVLLEMPHMVEVEDAVNLIRVQM